MEKTFYFQQTDDKCQIYVTVLEEYVEVLPHSSQHDFQKVLKKKTMDDISPLGGPTDSPYFYSVFQNHLCKSSKDSFQTIFSVGKYAL